MNSDFFKKLINSFIYRYENYINNYRAIKLNRQVIDKAEFINRLTLPTHALKSIKILESEYEEDKIKTMKFTR